MASQPDSRARSRSPRRGDPGDAAAAEAGEPSGEQDAAMAPAAAELTSAAAPEDTPAASAAAAEPNGADAAPAAGGPEVPAHWLKAPAAAAEEKEPAAPPATTGKGKGSGKAGKAAHKAFYSQEDPAAPGDEETSAAALLAVAERLESGGEGAPQPAELGKLMRRAAARVGTLEKKVGELGQALMVVKTLAGRALDGGSINMPGQLPDDISASPDDGKSYLIKKGDADVQEQFQAMQQLRPSQVSTGSGALSATAKTKEEMDQARRMRLERLEAQQASKKKEMEDAAAKSKSKEAMFEKPFTATSRLLGKF